MALAERVTIDKIEVLEDGLIQVRQATVVEKDGAELNRAFHRWVLTPGQDITSQSARVKAVAAAVWTPEVVAAYADKTSPKDVTPASP
jgi:hypothetical protein